MTDRIDDNLGVLDQAEGRWRLRFERTLPHPPAKVWRAITEPEHIKAWFPTTIDGERATGAPLHFEFPFDEAPAIVGEMLVYEAPKVMELRWGDELLRFELTDADGATVLRFTNLFDEVGKAARDGAGWHGCLDLLGYEVSGEKPPFDPETRWSDVHPSYVATFPPEASTIGPPDWHPQSG